MWQECKVKRKHINEGTPEESECCAVALAIEDHPIFDGYQYVSVHDRGIDFCVAGKNASDGYASEAFASEIHPDDEYKYQYFIQEFDMIETDKDREYLKEFSFRFKLT
tara:strand:- start:98 stop:421 length:324 start_codon:yes stop_codon:yes gene_type:complete